METAKQTAMQTAMQADAIETIAKAPQHVQGHAWELLATGKANNADHAIAYAVQAAKRRESSLTANMSELSDAGVVEGSNAINYSPMPQNEGMRLICDLLADAGYYKAASDAELVAAGEKLAPVDRTDRLRKAELRRLIQRLIEEQK